MKAAIGCFIGLVFGISSSAEPLLEGRVRLESGEPVADAQVRIFDLSDLRQGAIARAMTDGTGYFALPLAALAGRALPQRFALGPNYPNPFNPSTIIPYQLAVSSAVRLEVFNLLGQHIATLVDGERPAGFHTTTWHATDAAGRAVGAGVYIYRMTVGVESQTGRMVLLDGQAGLSAGGATSVIPGASGIGGSAGEGVQVYGLVVSGSGLIPYVDSSFRVEAGMAPVELVVSSGSYSAGKAVDFDDFFDFFNNQQEEEETGEQEDEEEETPEEEEEETGEQEEEEEETPEEEEEETGEQEEEEEETPEEEEEEEEETPEEETGEGDLIVYSSISRTNLGTGQAFALRARVQNQGTDEAQDLVLSYYRSSNATISTQDTLLGTDAVGSLAASSISRNKSISLTAPFTPGTYYYGACVAGVSNEGDTLNYCSTGVRVIVADEEDQVTIPDGKLRAAIAAALGKASSETITKGEMTTFLTTLSKWYGGISDLTGLEFATNLRTLDLYSNNISDLSALSGLTNLRELNLGENQITDLSALSGLTNLEYLNLYANQITDISVLSGLTKLEWLELRANQITDISVLSGLTKLEWLGLGANQITDFSVLSGLTNLEGLQLWSNQIRDLSVLSGLTNLRTLWLNSNRITDISVLSGLTKLERLGLGDNQIRDISVLSGLTNLRTLWLNSNRITDISVLSGLTKLERLSLNSNRITDISVLSGLTKLERLSLNSNRITDISVLSGLTKLWELSLQFNNFTDISPLRNLANLEYLNLQANPLVYSVADNDYLLALVTRGAQVIFDPPLRESDFDIELVFLSPYTDEQKRTIQYAARRWESIITGDLPDHEFTQGWSGACGDQSYEIPAGERIDDLRIYVIDQLSSYGSYWASVTMARTTPHLPLLGCISVPGNGDVELHEIGHVLGIGTLWDDFIQNPPGDPHFNGPLAIAAFDEAGGRDYAGAKVPVDRVRGIHWRSPPMFNEIMAGSGGLISAITVQALADLGWVVDVTQANPYTLPSTAAKASAKIAAPAPHAEPEWSCGVGEQREPIYVVD